MIRNLFVIACASFVLASFCLGGAIALGGPHIFGHHFPHYTSSWRVNLGDGNSVAHIVTDDGQSAPDGSATRDLAWSGGDALEIDVPADVDFTQAPGPAKLTVSGPKALVDRVELSGSHLGLSDDASGDGKLKVVMTAPDIRRFAIDGDASLAVTNFDQDELDVDVSGHGDVTAKGKARATHVSISGDGEVNLGALAVQEARAEISGSGRASLAPSAAADLNISGSGEVDLLTHPAKLTSDVSGSGRIVEGTPAQPG